MSLRNMKFKPAIVRPRAVAAMVALGLAAGTLGGCVYQPYGYGGYGYGYGYGAPAPAVVVAPPPIVVGGGWGRGWR